MNTPAQDQGQSGQSSAGNFAPDSLDDVAALLAERRTRNRVTLEGGEKTETAPDGPSPEQSPEASAVEATEETPDPEQPEGQAEEAEAEAEQYIELDGEEVPLSQVREWKSGGMMQADYSRKTQVLAEQSKAVRQMEEALTQAH